MADFPWNDKKTIANLHSPTSTVKVNFAYNTMRGRKPWKIWTTIYWFAHKPYLAVIRYGGIWQCMKPFENWWLNCSKFRLVAIPYMFPPFLIHFLMFHLLFPQLLWVFPMIPLKFPPVYYFRSYAFHVHCSSYYLNLVTICKDTAIRNVLNEQRFLCFLGIA